MADLVFPGHSSTPSNQGDDLITQSFSSSGWLTFSPDGISTLIEEHGCRYAERLVQASLAWLGQSNGFPRLSEVVKVTSGLIELLKLVRTLDQRSSGEYLQECPKLKDLMASLQKIQVINDIALKVVQFAEQHRTWYRSNIRFLISDILQGNPFLEDARREAQRVLSDASLNSFSESDWDEEMEETFQVTYRSRIVSATEDILPHILNEVYDLIEGYALQLILDNRPYVTEVGEAFDASISEALNLVLIQSTVMSEGATSVWNADGPLVHEVLQILEEFRDELRSQLGIDIASSVQSILNHRRFVAGLREDPGLEHVLRLIDERSHNNNA